MAQNLVTGKSTSGGTVTVYWYGTTTKPTINKTDGATSQSNPMTAAADGSYGFWVDDGHYTIVNGTPTGNRELRLKQVTQPSGLPHASEIQLTPFRGNTSTTLESWLEGATGNTAGGGPIAGTTATFSSTLSATTATLSGLSITRVPYVSTGGLLVDSANFTYVATTASGGITLANTTASTTTATGSIVTAGGVGVAKGLFVGEVGNFAGVLTAANATASSTPLTGGFVASGGIGVSGVSYFGEAIHQSTPEIAKVIYGYASELLTLNTGGLTTDTSANLLPAGAIIDAVVTRITTTITTATNWAVGDPTTAARFSAANATKTAGTTQVGIDHWSGAVTTLAAGPSQAAAAKVRITCTGSNPGAGVVRITVFYHQFVAPAS